MPDQPPHSQRYAVSLILALFVIGVCAWCWIPVHYIADDSYFYLVIARNLILEGQQSFSGLYPTNGFHPLWEYVLAGYTWLVQAVQPAAIYSPTYAVPLSATVCGLGALAFWRTARRLRLDPLVLVGPPLFYLMVTGVLYSEAHAYYATLACLLYLTVRLDFQGRHTPWQLGLAATLVFLARLDSIFFVFCYGCWLWRHWGFVRATQFGLAFWAGATPYLLCNLYFFSGLMPVSGWLKSTFPHILAYNHIFKWSGAATTLLGYNVIFGLIPLLGALIIWLWLRRGLEVPRSLLGPLLGGALMHAAYLILFTRGFSSWYWYYLLPQIAFAWALALAWERRPVRWHAVPMPRAAMLILVVGLAGASYARSIQVRATGDKFMNSVYFANEMGLTDETLLVSDAPGTLAFYTRNHIIAVDMLTGNRRLYKELVESDNALDVFKTLAAQQGKPIRYALYIDGGWLRPSSDLCGLEMTNPQVMNKTQVLGIWDFPDGPIKVIKRNGQVFFAAWAVPSADTSGSATQPRATPAQTP